MRTVAALLIAVLLLLRGGAPGSAPAVAREEQALPPSQQRAMPAGTSGRLVLGPPAGVRPERKAPPPVIEPPPPVSEPPPPVSEPPKKTSKKKMWLGICLAAIFGPPVLVTCTYNVYSVLKKRYPETITFDLSGGGRMKKYITVAVVGSYVLAACLAVYKLIADAITG